ncbi:hypothetical protein EOD41_19660 [Mucilaginibacter limnophilus]|uniref:Uncharacterized protein n=1 Tax=Mucilaginibacter limnophilus TaxID=1932778 RepID=A0A437MHV6_9SPHI|nr:PAS domain-containing protein [Mucilaginibacter limnophilus]RVT97221.1 hypothetical protein EOD41_19660 [Mucilaginibacter limnophilus]
MENTQKNFDTITELNELLENYFRNTIIPQLFVDANLVLRKFTPPAMRQFKLKDSDIGRPIEDIIDNFRFPTFVENIHQVIATGEILEKEVQTLDKSWFQMNILPYVMRANYRTNGVIITFVDITARIRIWMKQTCRHLVEAIYGFYPLWLTMEGLYSFMVDTTYVHLH